MKSLPFNLRRRVYFDKMEETLGAILEYGNYVNEAYDAEHFAFEVVGSLRDNLIIPESWDDWDKADMDFLFNYLYNIWEEYLKEYYNDVKDDDSISEEVSRIKEVMGVITENLSNRMSNYLIDGKYLYHYTLTDNLESIMDEGLIFKRYPNSFYEEGTEGIFLTTSPSLYNANLPQSLMDVMDEYYENEDLYDEKPIVRLTIDVTNLNYDLFDVDDDYKMNLYGWNKAGNDEDKIIESLDLWKSISYKGIISPKLIKNIDFNYGA